MYKAKNKLGSENVDDLFRFDLNPNTNSTFLIPNVNTEYMGKLSLRWFGPVVWETMLPESYKSIASLEKFKDVIMKWVPEKCRCTILDIV